jgi:hypothetical protein
MKLINDIVTYTLSLIASVLLLYVILGSIAIAKADPPADFLARHTQQMPSLILPMPAAPSGYAIVQRERPAPLYYQNDTYTTLKIVPLDKQGRPSQPTYTLEDMLYDAIRSNQPRR